MPDMRMRRLLLVAVLTGIILSCVGVTLYVTSANFRELDQRMFWVRGSLIVAWLILVPIFFYMMRLRRTARRGTRKRLVEQSAQLDQQLSELVTPEGIRASGEQETVQLDAGAPGTDDAPPAQEDNKK